MNKTQFKDFVHRLNNQDCRATSHPIWQVRDKNEIVGVDPDYHNYGYVWINQDDCEHYYETDNAMRAYLIENGGDSSEDIKWQQEVVVKGQTFKRLYHMITHVIISTHFTEQAANDYIKQNRHNLNEPYTYVDSQWRCHEWIDVVDMLKTGKLILKEGAE